MAQIQLLSKQHAFEPQGALSPALTNWVHSDYLLQPFFLPSFLSSRFFSAPNDVLVNQKTIFLIKCPNGELIYTLSLWMIFLEPPHQRQSTATPISHPHRKGRNSISSYSLHSRLLDWFLSLLLSFLVLLGRRWWLVEHLSPRRNAWFSGSYGCQLRYRELLCPYSFFCVWPCCMACGIIVLQPGIEPGPRQWKQWVLTTGPPGNSPLSLLLSPSSQAQHNEKSPTQ